MRIRLLAVALLFYSAAFAQQSQLPNNNCGSSSQLPGLPTPGCGGDSQLPPGGTPAGPPPVNCSPINGLDYTKACDIVYFMGVFQ